MSRTHLVALITVMLLGMGIMPLTNAEPLYGTLKKIKETGTIRVGIVKPRYHFRI